ncbi:MAG: hypothetical protein ABH863_05115, partial [Candidatus Micrarchaeota archaeon]
MQVRGGTFRWRYGGHVDLRSMIIMKIYNELNGKYLWSIFVVTLFFLIAATQLSEAKIAQAEVPSDLSFRSGLELETYYYQGAALLQKQNYYYEFKPLGRFARKNINPCISWETGKGGECLEYKESGYDWDDLEYRKVSLAGNHLMWKFYAIGQGPFYDVDAYLSFYMSTSGILTTTFGGTTAKTFSQKFYQGIDPAAGYGPQGELPAPGSLLGEMEFGKVADITKTYENNAGIYNFYSNDLNSMATTKENTMEGTLSITGGLTSTSGNVQGIPEAGVKVVKVEYREDVPIVANAQGGGWDLSKQPRRVSVYEFDNTNDMWDPDDLTTFPYKGQREKPILDTFYSYGKYFNGVTYSATEP